MGCDIHQFYTIKNGAGDTEFKEFVAVPCFWDTNSPEYIDFYKKIYDKENTQLDLPEPFTGRSYDFFSIIIGTIRSDYFQICSNDKHLDWPENEIPKDFERDWMHSFCWYYATDLIKCLIKTIDKIQRYQKAMIAKDPSYIKDGEDYDESMIELIQNYINKLQTSINYIQENFKDYNVNSLKILFALDN